MLKERKVFNELGYDLNTEEAKVVLDVVSEIISCMEQYDDNDIKNIVYNKNSFIYVELAYFTYETGMNNLHNKLNSFEKNKKIIM